MTKFRPLPSLERLNELLEVVEIPPGKFGEWSGLVRKIKRGQHQVGSVAGSRERSSTQPDRVEWRVRVDGVKYIASRIIYYMTHGEGPGDVEVDHEDQNPLNNNAWNLRLDVKGDIQKVNQKMRRDNTSGAVGVYWHKINGKWIAQVQIESKLKNLGCFTCKIEAAHTVNKKWVELGWHKVGRKLNDLRQINCNCSRCVTNQAATAAELV